MPFQDANNSLYNAIATRLLKSAGLMLFQPSNPVLETADLWNHYFNLIPEKSLLFNYSLSPGAQFFDNYCALNSALRPTPFQAPPEIRKGFQAFLRGKAAPLSPSQYPAMFQEWASHKFPPLLATAAATALSTAINTDPVADGQLRLMPYLGDPSANPPVPPKQPDWTATFEQLQTMLAAAPAMSFNYRHSDASKDISKTWAGGRSRSSFGLTAADNLTSTQSARFAESDFTLEASFAHVCPFPAAPGQWFSPGTMAIAFRNKDKAPWVAGSPITWESTFDEDKGNLARFLVDLIAVDTMNIRVTSFAKFTKGEQTVIKNSVVQGLWPFYLKPGARRIATNASSFDSTGQMEITTTSLPGVAIIIGGNVVSAGSWK